MSYRAEQFVRAFEEHSPILGERVFIDPSAVVIGDVGIGDDSSIWPNTTVTIACCILPTLGRTTLKAIRLQLVTK
jgi:hypothetical protein